MLSLLLQHRVDADLPGLALKALARSLHPNNAEAELPVYRTMARLAWANCTTASAILAARAVLSQLESRHAPSLRPGALRLAQSVRCAFRGCLCPVWPALSFSAPWPHCSRAQCESRPSTGGCVGLDGNR